MECFNYHGTLIIRRFWRLSSHVSFSSISPLFDPGCKRAARNCYGDSLLWPFDWDGEAKVGLLQSTEVRHLCFKDPFRLRRLTRHS